jgi:acetoin utilization deacetylase AcuC-like enzyme
VPTPLTFRFVLLLNSTNVRSLFARPPLSIQKQLSNVLNTDHHDFVELSLDSHVAPASLEDVLLVHDERYLAALRDKASEAMSVSGLMLDESTYLTRSTYIDSLASAGVVKSMVDEIMRCNSSHVACDKTVDDFVTPTGFALVRPPGHHACPARPMGFCLVNNAAFATRYLLREHADVVKRVAIIDFDVHHGNGTQDIFYNDESVLFVSTHQDGSFPGTGKIADTGLGDGLGRLCSDGRPHLHAITVDARTLHAKHRRDHAQHRAARRCRPRSRARQLGADRGKGDPVRARLYRRERRL